MKLPTLLNVSPRSIILELQRHNFDMDSFCKAHDITLNDLLNPTKRIPINVIQDLVEAEFRETNNPFWHFDLQNRIPLGAYRAIECLAETSVDFGSAVRKLAKYAKFINEAANIKVLKSPYPNQIEVILDLEVPTTPNFRRFLAEAGFKAIIERFSYFAVAPVNPVAIEFEHNPSLSIQAYSQYFSCPVYFGCEHNKMIFDTLAWTTPMLHSDPLLNELLEHHLEEDMEAQHIHFDNGIVSKVKKTLINLLTEKAPSIEIVAAELAMSTRSLQRALQNKGTTYLKILEETRCLLAKKYISMKDIPLSDIAFLLGFSDQSSFNRAFRRYTGITPLQYKNEFIKEQETITSLSS